MKEILLRWVTPADLKAYALRCHLDRWLTSKELQFFARLRSPQRQHDWLAGRLAAKQLVEAKYLLPPEEIEILQDANGAPECRLLHTTTAIALSIAHSAGHALAAIVPSSRAVGIDLEMARPVHADLARRVLSQREQAQYRSSDQTGDLLIFWTLKEAARKAHRVRPLPNFREIEVTYTDTKHAQIVFQQRCWSSYWGRRSEFVWACVWG